MPRVVYAALDTGHVAQMDWLASPSGCRAIQPKEPKVTDNRANQVLPATETTDMIST